MRANLAGVPELELAVADNDGHTPAAAHHVLCRCFSALVRLLFGEGAMPPLACNFGGPVNIIIGDDSDDERAPHSLPHYPPSFGHLTSAKYQGDT